MNYEWFYGTSLPPPPVIHNATYTKYTCINIVNIMWGGALYQWGGGVAETKNPQECTKQLRPITLFYVNLTFDVMYWNVMRVIHYDWK